ncbi:MAG TPA: beta-N-acetylhexosaminidase, partial [Ktedonobacteraceae bacterium]|nr:beta-N-acetylhexosaminidase [Ktedonobacteraceae bacterium]
MKKRRMFWLGMVLLSMIIAFFSLFPFHLLAPINFAANEVPKVVPALREWHGNTGSFILGSSSRILLDPAAASQLQNTARLFQQDLAVVTGWSPAIVTSNDPGEDNFFLTIKTQDTSIGDEGYLLDVGSSTTINAHTVNGIFYGTRTILQILQADSNHETIPRGLARDFPKYKERGFMLDVGRKFVPLDTLKDYVRLMAWYKLNDF